MPARDIRLVNPRGMPVTNYIEIGFTHNLEGVAFWVKDPVTGDTGKLLDNIDPEFARTIARGFTLESFACDALRAQKSRGQ